MMNQKQRDLQDAYLNLIGELNGVPESDAAAIRGLLSEVEADAELHQSSRALLRGYMGYFFPDILTQVDCEAELQFVVAQEPENQLALHFLAITFLIRDAIPEH